MSQEQPPAPSPRSPWPARFGRLAVLFVGLTAALVAWRLAPAPARRAVAPLANALTARLAAELRPIWLGVSDRFKEPPPDPAAMTGGAARLAPPTGPARRRPARPGTGAGEKAPLLSDRGIPVDQELRPAVGGPVLLDSGETDQTRSMANKLILVAGGLAAFFMLVAWHRGDPNAKTFT